MTQAHKTPGALVEMHPWTNEKGMEQYYGFMQGRVFEVMEECIRGHLTVRDVFTGEIFGGHDENFKTLDKKRIREVRKKLDSML